MFRSWRRIWHIFWGVIIGSAFPVDLPESRAARRTRRERNYKVRGIWHTDIMRGPVEIGMLTTNDDLVQPKYQDTWLYFVLKLSQLDWVGMNDLVLRDKLSAVRTMFHYDWPKDNWIFLTESFLVFQKECLNGGPYFTQIAELLGGVNFIETQSKDKFIRRTIEEIRDKHTQKLSAVAQYKRDVEELWTLRSGLLKDILKTDALYDQFRNAFNAYSSSWDDIHAGRITFPKLPTLVVANESRQGLYTSGTITDVFGQKKFYLTSDDLKYGTAIWQAKSKRVGNQDFSARHVISVKINKSTLFMFSTLSSWMEMICLVGEVHDNIEKWSGQQFSTIHSNRALEQDVIEEDTTKLEFRIAFSDLTMLGVFTANLIARKKEFDWRVDTSKLTVGVDIVHPLDLKKVCRNGIWSFVLVTVFANRLDYRYLCTGND